MLTIICAARESGRRSFFAAVPSLLRAALFFCRLVSLCRAVAVCPSTSAAPPPFARQPLLRLFCLLVCLCRPAASVCPPALAAGGNFFPPIFAKGLKPAKKCGILFS